MANCENNNAVYGLALAAAREKEIQWQIIQEFGLPEQCKDAELWEEVVRTSSGMHFERRLTWKVGKIVKRYNRYTGEPQDEIEYTEFSRQLEPSYERWLPKISS